MLGNVLHPQFVDNLAMGLVARFNIKGDVKDVAKFINKFGVDDGDECIFIPSGFPIGKVQSLDHLNQIKREYSKKENLYYNITTGKSLKGGNPSMYYGEGWCVKRNTPAYEAIRKIDNENSEEEVTVEIEEKDGWEIVKDTHYIWARSLGKVVGRLKNSEPEPLLQKHIDAIKDTLEWQRLSKEQICAHKLPFQVDG